MSITGKGKRIKRVKNVTSQSDQRDVLYKALTPTSDIQNGQDKL